jgi:hypothetical protein
MDGRRTRRPPPATRARATSAVPRAWEFRSILQHVGRRRQQSRVAAEFVEHEAADQGAMLRGQQLMGAEEVREGAAAIDVADDQRGGAAASATRMLTMSVATAD